ncbi:MAG TPA: hypothetical protein VFL42_11925, partial [Terriglobales bacterium]|nr:hypothetical protein [Terriglobales bacterium]
SPAPQAEHEQFQALPGAANDDAVTRGLLGHALTHCGRSRDEIAARMSFLLAHTITAGVLNKFIAQGKFPFAWTRAFCAATDDWRLLHHLAEQAGFLLLAQQDADLVSLGELVVQQERAQLEIERHAKNIIARRSE